MNADRRPLPHLAPGNMRERRVNSVGGPIGWGDIGYGVVETGAGQETLRVVEPGMVVIDGRARNSTHREGDS
jgi:hypothetical protein